MKLLLLEETEFRGKVITVNEKADIPEGVAFMLIANGKAKKISDDEFNEVVKVKRNGKNANDKTNN